MRVLSEHMSIPELNTTGLTASVVANLVENSENKVKNKDADTIDNKNLTLARQVEGHKLNLIQVLSRFPVAALWLCSKYDRDSDLAEDTDDETALSSESDSLIKSIKTLYQQLELNFSAQSTSVQFAEISEKLAFAVKQFPFVFEDLVNLADLVVLANQTAGLTFTPQEHLTKKEVEIIVKRLQTQTTRQSKLKRQLQDFCTHHDAGFLFRNNVLNEKLGEVVLHEQRWLLYRQQLATANIKLVQYIANQYKGNFLDFEDLVQEGNTGLLRAIDRFKYQLGFQFSTYAGYWIRQGISRALSRSERIVRIPCGQIATINKVYRSKEELTAKAGKEPDVKTLAEHMGLSEDDINTIMSISQTSVALEAFDDGDEETFAPIDYLEQKIFTHPADTIAIKQLKNLMASAIKTLNPRETKILSAHFGLGVDQSLTLQEIGTELKLTRERVRQIQVMALAKIRLRYGEQLLSFL